MENMGITLDTDKIGPKIKHVTEDPDRTVLKKRFKKLSSKNHTVNAIEEKIQVKEDAKLIQQKKPIPIHLEQSTGKEMD